VWGFVGAGWGVVVLIVALHAWTSEDALRTTGAALAALGWVALWAILAAVWMRQYVQMEWAFQRNRALYWTWASILLVVGQALVMFVPSSWLVGAVGLLLHLSGLMAISIAITRLDLPNVRAVLRQSFILALLVLLMTVLLLVSLVVFSPGLQSLQPTSVLLMIAVAAGLALIYEPSRELIGRLADRLVPHTGYDLDEKLRQYSLAIGNIIDLERLAVVVTETVGEVLDVRRAALILVTEEAQMVRLRPLPESGSFPSEEVILDHSDPFVTYMREQKQPLLQLKLEQSPAFQDLSPPVREWLNRMGMEVYVPIFAPSILLGMLAAGPPRSGEPFGRREQAFLISLAYQTAVALRNARMFADVLELNFDVAQLNEELRRTMERLERLNQAKTDFLAVASHELRTPLTHVKGYADLLMELCQARTITVEQTAEISHSISTASDRLTSIIEDIINMSQLEANKPDLFLTPTTLKAVMRFALEPWLEPIQRRRMHLTVQGVEDIPPIVADLQRLAQALGHLISNALKYTPDGGRITVHARLVNGEQFEVVVSDTGVGISAADQDVIFEKFFRVERTDLHSSGQFSFKGAGPGLGLAIARGVIEAHGGRIWVVSEGCDEVRCPGSAFHVVLPLGGPPAADDTAQPFTVLPEGLE
nr:GAF domain-containing protein [Chloroflexota bacterium]